MTSVSVTIVNHSARELLRACLASLRRHPYTAGPMEVIVLDNASEDGSVGMLRADFPEVKVLAETVRRGFGANQNRAIAAAGGDLVFLLNPDAVVHEGTIDHLAAAVPEGGPVAAGGPVRNADGSWRQARPHPFLTPWTPYAQAIGLRRLESKEQRGVEIVTDGWPSGGCCMVRRAAFLEAGGFDEAFFMYAEDADLFARLAAGGQTFAWVGDAVVTHPYADEAAAQSRRRETEIVRAEARYMRKHFGGIAAWVYRGGVVLDAASRIVLLSVPGLRRLVQGGGVDPAVMRKARVARLVAALTSTRRPGLAESAAAWNREHGTATPG